MTAFGLLMTVVLLAIVLAAVTYWYSKRSKKVPPGWRLLGSDEVIQEGDTVWNTFSLYDGLAVRNVDFIGREKVGVSKLIRKDGVPCLQKGVMMKCPHCKVDMTINDTRGLKRKSTMYQCRECSGMFLSCDGVLAKYTQKSAWFCVICGSEVRSREVQGEVVTFCPTCERGTSVDSANRTFLAERMSKLFGEPHSGPCACIGVPTCGENRCSIWWDIVMKDPEVYRQVEEFYQRNYRMVEETAAACPPPCGPPTG